MSHGIFQRCGSCMRLLDEHTICPHCSVPAHFEQESPFLPARCLLSDGRFGVGMAMQQNGDGITYLGYDDQLRKTVCIREFFPAAITVRGEHQLQQTPMQSCEAVWQDCAQNFTELWRKLQRLRGLSALLSTIEVFEEHGTVYAVYEYFESITFREFLLQGKQGFLSWDRARALLVPVLSTLGSLHQQGILHRGISPTTLLLGSDGKIRISGFSIWQARTAHGDLTADLADGYAALEQYGLGDKHGAWTDIYAFAAVLYRALTGSDPEDAVSRRHNDRLMIPAQFAEKLPAYVIHALINSMQVFPEERTRSVELFRAELSASPVAAARALRAQEVPSPPKMKDPPPPPPKKTTPTTTALKVAVLTLLVGLLIYGGITLYLQQDKLKELLGLTTHNRPPVTDFETEPMNLEDQVKIPFLEGQIYSDVVAARYAEEFVIMLQYAEDPHAPLGRILAQDIQAGTMISRGSVLTLTLCEGSGEVELPSVVGESLSSARKKLEALGLVVKAAEVRNDGSHKEQTIKAMTPEAGRLHSKKDIVYLTYWGTFQAPDFTVESTPDITTLE